ncbi:hypothetical protein T05_9113 [Trichinella murrelli]|uniref:Uncharacterized protein n=1 Tax=Trichinella murrelli TaxID=144512 RepID=A0A0V0TBH3_9BILA|nr:hypothetical protein T05_9113 [Trichinella murrelli]
MALRVEVDAVTFIIGTNVVSLIIRIAVHPSILFLIAMDCVIRKFDALKPMALSNCVSYGSDVFPCHARRICVTVKTRAAS